ncbi:transcriptional regulator [Spongiibacter sp. KMU-158]|uniref:Transcriptional regulator n=1 Tax=Spongiibacter pelagi TaxID=2760804 RepID=A0A927C4W3_9GAMM|nr:transcriptional regulator [Spongiibacter pelagi]MBD2859631.1 transcriptional regulator [Spongiibacter pelagi]
MNRQSAYKAWSQFHAAAGLGGADEYDRLVEMADNIIESGKANDGGPMEMLFGLLCDRIEQHDRAQFIMPEASPDQVVRFLMEQHGLTQSQIPEIGNQSAVSHVLNGRRDLTLAQIKGLSSRFSIPADILIK